MDFLNKVSFVFISKNAGLVLDFITSVLIVRYLGIDDYGHYTSLYLLPILLASLGSFGFGPSIVYHINRGDNNLRSYLFTFTILGLVLGAGFYVVVGLGASSINEYFYENRLDNRFFLIALIFVPVVIIQKLLRAIIRGIYDVKVFSILIDFVVPSLRLICILSVLIGNFGLFGVVMTPAIVQATVTLYMFYYLFKKSASENQFGFVNRVMFVEITKFALKSFLGSFLQKSNISLVTLIASTLLSFREIGVLTLAQKLLSLISSVSGSLLTVLMPKVSRSSISEIKKFIPKVTSILLWFNGVALAGYVIFIDIIVYYLYGEGLSAIGDLTIPLGLATILLPVCNVLLLVVTFTGDPIKKSYARGAGFFVNIASLYPLYIAYGTFGVAISIALGQGIIFLLSLYFFRSKFSTISFSKLFIVSLDDLKTLTRVILKKGI